MDVLPKLRNDIQLLPADVQGQRMLVVKDMLGLTDNVIALPSEVAVLLPLFDGEHSIIDLQQTMMRSCGNQLVMRSDAEIFVRELDRLLIVQSATYFRRREEIRQEFASMANRPAAMAGTAYPEEPGELREFIAGILPKPLTAQPFGPIRALIAPHIDLRVGGEVYGKAYGPLSDRDLRRLVILGTGHGLTDGLFCVTAKRYETPLGGFPADSKAVELLRRAGAGCLPPDDFAHRNEHSIEFQVLFLRSVLTRDIPLVPILVGGLGERLAAVRFAEIPGVSDFLAALRELCGRETLVVAGVDFCHVGPKFGHPDPARAYQSEFEEHDRRLLAALCRGSAEDFWAEAQRVEDRFNVCGLPALATLLEILPGLSGDLLGYSIWHEPPTRSAVSYAALALR